MVKQLRQAINETPPPTPLSLLPVTLTRILPPPSSLAHPLLALGAALSSLTLNACTAVNAIGHGRSKSAGPRAERGGRAHVLRERSGRLRPCRRLGPAGASLERPIPSS